MSEFVIRDKELAGFGLAGRRQLNNTIQICGGENRFIEEWPEEITFHGNTYTLEQVIKGAVDPKTGTQWENAEYA